jgi:class 3 adenylate cyclase/tetratricopeptide (TPR) repeat protein
MTDARLSNCSRYVSGALTEWSCFAEAAPSLPSIEYFEGAFLFVDISGFTRLAGRLSRRGGAGVERISEILTDFFTDLVALVEEEGGVVFRFEGDALLAAWRRASETLSSSLLCCCSCALEIQQRFRNWKVDDQKLQMRMSIGVGEIQLMHLGNAARRCHVLPAGEAVEQATSLSVSADTDEIVVSREAWPLIHERCEAEPHKDGAMRLLRLKAECSRNVTSKQSGSAIPTRDLSNYLPRALLALLNSSLPDWVGELRVVTIAFVNISFSEKTLSLADLNNTFLKVERNIDCLGGEILETAINRHGLEILCVFGLPSEAREGIGRRAILAAMNIRAELSGEGLNVSAGVATGQVFCGPIGPKHRRQYSVVGAAVYLASRISSVAAGRILVDEATVMGTLRSIRFDGPWPLHLAGIRESVKSFVPLGTVDAPERLRSTEFINREREIEVLHRLLRRTASGSTEVVLIDGEPGVGKTALLSAFADQCAQAGLRILEGAADALDRVTPYLAWRPVILQCLELKASGRNADETAKAVQTQLAKNSELASFAPLLDDALDLQLTENWGTSNMPRDVRAENLRRLLVWIVTQRLAREQNLIILEDVHWMDESSWGLLIDIIQSDSMALVIISCRNLDAIQPVVRRLSVQAIDYSRLSLRRLSKKHTIDLASRRLNQQNISDWLARLILDTTEGNPFFVDEICHVINQEKSRYLPSTETDDPIDRDCAIRLPKSLEIAVLSRIDHLSMDDQLVVKLASVIGTTFSASRLDMLKPLAQTGLNVASSIDRMLAQHLLKPLPGNVGEFAFRHKIIRDLVYDSMLTEQKREAHSAVAQSLEAESPSADSVRLPVILQHWRCANNPKKMVAYLDQVAALRLRQFDNTTAITLINECLSLAHEHGIELDKEKRAVCQLLLGEACLGKGLMAGARKSYEEGLSLLGQALPKHTAGLMASLFWQTFRQCWTRLTGAPSTEIASVSASQRKAYWQRFYTSAQAYEDLTRLYYVAGEKSRLLHATLKATNLAEGLREYTPALAINYATLGAICGVIPLRGQAEHYFKRAAGVAKLYDEPNVSTIVYLTGGLYRTSIGDWAQAKANFVTGLDIAKAIGDRKRWCELAISLETISGPWLLTPAFSEIQTWDELGNEISKIGRDREDSQVVGCAVLGSLRGNRILGRSSLTRDRIEEMEELLRRDTHELELIHRVEGCAHLASVEFEKGNVGAGKEWLQKCERFLPGLNPGMKVRTLPALSFLFDACLQQMALAGSGRRDPRQVELASRVSNKLNHFARIYPIGQPEKLRCQGDLCAVSGRAGKAVMLWRDSLQRAIRLKMPLAAFQAAERLKRAGYGRDFSGRDAIIDRLEAVGGYSDNVRDIAEHALGEGGSIDYLPFP